MLKLMYFATIISLTALLACSGPEKNLSPTAVAQAPAAEFVLDAPPSPVETSVETPVEDPVPAEDPGQTESPIPAGNPTTAPVEAPEPTDTPSEITPGPGIPSPSSMNGTGLLTSNPSEAELSCLSETGDPQQLMKLINSPGLASPEEEKILAGCLENETLLKIFLKGFTDQTGPLSSDTSACVNAGFQNLDLRTMMLTDPEGPDGEAGAFQVMAGLIIVLACLDEPEWQTASQTLDIAPEGREAIQCVMNMLGGPEGISASLESKGGEPPTAFFNAATECRLTIIEEP